MTVGELKQIMKDVPDDMQIQMVERGGFIDYVNDAYVEEDDDGKQIFYISH